MSKCPDCDGDLRPIQVLERGEENRHYGLRFAEADAEPGLFFGRADTVGDVVTFLCGTCKRIFLYGLEDRRKT